MNRDCLHHSHFYQEDMLSPEEPLLRISSLNFCKNAKHIINYY